MGRKLILFSKNVVVAKNINDAWRDTMWCCIRNGYRYVVNEGSCIGQCRHQLENLMVIIEEPWQRPLAVIVPEQVGFTSPTSEEKIEEYFYNFLVSDKKPENTVYTYGEFISKQMDRAINSLSVSEGNTNQAVIQIGDSSSIYLSDPPCLRIIDFKVVNGCLNMSVYFRSWDLFAAFPENIGGLQLLKEYMLIYLPQFKDGKIIAYSAGCHLYEMYFPLVNSLNIDKI